MSFHKVPVLVILLILLLALVVPASAENYGAYTEMFNVSNWATYNVTISPDAIRAPNGEVTADLMVEDASTALRGVKQNVDSAVGVSGNLTWSFYAKAKERFWLRITIQNRDATNYISYFNISDGTLGISSNPAIIGYTNFSSDGWYRCSLIIPNGAGATNPNLYIRLSMGDGNATYTGDGSSGLYLWGFQVNAGDFPKEYIVQNKVPATPTPVSSSVVPIGNMTNAATNQSISTYDGSGKSVHPAIIYNSTGWNGYKYLLSFDPYPGASSTYENPSMRYSNDGNSWENITGGPDPIIVQPASGFYSDQDIVLTPDGTLYLFYRWSDSMTPTVQFYNYTTTTDGVTWTTPVTTDLPWLRSASFLYNNGRWECFGHNMTSYVMEKRFTSDDPKYWIRNSLIYFYGTDDTSWAPPSGNQWHSEVNLFDNQYMMLLQTTGDTKLYFFTSNNTGIYWKIANNGNPVITNSSGGAWDEHLYKGTFLEEDNGYRVWYGGYNPANDYYIGYTTYNVTSAPVASFTTNVTSGTVPLAVGFTDTSTNTPTDWDWYINNVKFSDLQNPEYTFTEAGVYDVSLYAANGASGDWENKTGYITATNWYDLQCENQTGNITLNLFSNSTSSLGWNWDDPVNITKIAEDGLYVLSFDNSSDYFIGMGYSPESWHKLKIYNETDFGQLNCTTDAIPVTPTPIPIMPSTESNVNPANLFQYWPYALLALGLVVVFKKW